MKCVLIIRRARCVELGEFETGVKCCDEGGRGMLFQDGAEGGEAGAGYATGSFDGRPEHGIQ